MSTEPDFPKVVDAYFGADMLAIVSAGLCSDRLRNV